MKKAPEIAESYAETSDAVTDDYIDKIVILKIDTKHLDLNLLHLDKNVIDGGDTFEYHGTIPYQYIELY